MQNRKIASIFNPLANYIETISLVQHYKRVFEWILARRIISQSDIESEPDIIATSKYPFKISSKSTLEVNSRGDLQIDRFEQT